MQPAGTTGATTGTNPNSTAELFSPAQGPNTSAGAQAGTPLNLTQTSTSLPGTELGFVRFVTVAPTVSNALMGQDVEPPLPTLAPSLPPGLLLVGPPPRPLSFATVGLPTAGEAGEEEGETWDDELGTQAGHAAEPAVAPLPTPNAEPMAAFSSELEPTTTVSFDLPAGWVQTFDALLDQPSHDQEASYQVTDQALGSWSMGLALAGLALESRQQSSEDHRRAREEARD